MTWNSAIANCLVIKVTNENVALYIDSCISATEGGVSNIFKHDFLPFGGWFWNWNSYLQAFILFQTSFKCF